jgi:glycosyltransferase involved in cell wall biosynthesis
MIIGVDMRLLLIGPERYGYFMRETFQILVKKHPEHQFYFLFDRPYRDQDIFSSNVRPVIVSTPARLSFLWKYWLTIKIPLLLKKIRADVFVWPDGYCSLTAGIAQCMVISDLGFLHHAKTYEKRYVKFFKKNTPKFLKKAKRIVTLSRFIKEDILKQYKIEENKIDVVYHGINDIFRPVPFDEKTRVKEKYAEGREYFMYVGSALPKKNAISLLKAFSVFKKRMQSGMKFIIAGKNEELASLINAYKYKSDIVLTGRLPEEELALLSGSAYALVFPSLSGSFEQRVAEALKCEVPVLASEKTSMQEVAGDAALYFDPNDYSDIADKMMLIYKDENLRKQLIEKGTIQIRQYDWEKSAELFWESILKAAKN